MKHKSLTKHQLRCLGAILALLRRHKGSAFDNGKAYFARHEIGQVVYSTYMGVQFKTMTLLRDRGFVRPQFDAAIDLVQSGACRCGCDRWTITDFGREEVLRNNVSVPTLHKPKKRAMVPIDLIGFFGGGEKEDPADWWKKEDDDNPETKGTP